MRTRVFALLGITAALAISPALGAAGETGGVRAAPNGIELPTGYKDWPVISSSHRVDNNTLRVIVGNEVAVRAAREGHTNPWPDGAILGKLVWKEAAKESWPTAIAPAQFVHAEFMFKDSVRWGKNGTGWGWARWVGMEQMPYGENAGFSQECIACHTPVKSNDWVFTHPAQLP
jgi:hypothetical protein